MQEMMDDAVRALKKRHQAVIPPAKMAQKTIQVVLATDNTLNCAQWVILPPIQKIVKTTYQPVPDTENIPKCAHRVILPPIQKIVRKTYQPVPDTENIPNCPHRDILPPMQKIWKRKPQPVPDTDKGSNQEQDGTQLSHDFTSEHPNTKKKLGEMELTRIQQGHPIFWQQWEKYLTDFEKEEITQYCEVWFFGKKTCKKIHGSNDVPFNNGYDSKLGYYNTVIRDHLAYRYEVLKELGRHTGGTVLKCKDHKTQEKVAIKVIRNKKRSIEEAQCELEMLEFLHRLDPSDRANIVHMKDSFVFRNHICIIFELFEKDFEMIIGCGPCFKLSMTETRHYAIDLLKCLLLLKEAGIVHGDLKPGNMLLSKKGHNKHAKVIDFGGSYLMSPTCSPKVVTYAYAAPEVLLNEPCDTSTDMWSLGCILTEMYTGDLIFGVVEKNTFKEIMKVLHFSVKDLIQLYPNQERYFGSGDEPTSEFRTLAAFLDTKDLYFMHFIQRCLELDPKKRMTPKEALKHPWIKKSRKIGTA